MPYERGMSVIKKALVLGTATVTTAAGLLMFGNQASARDTEFRAKLRDPSGDVVGSVTFRVTRDAMKVDAKLRNITIDPDKPNTFRGFHIHANNDPANGRGCVADPSAPPATWFVSADGHFSDPPGKDHGAHTGDLPSPLVLADGKARLKFTTHRIDPSMLRGRAVILHAGPDNFGNVPVGTADNQYTPNDPTVAPSLTKRTGNAGNRVACGVIKRSRWS